MKLKTIKTTKQHLSVFSKVSGDCLTGTREADGWGSVRSCWSSSAAESTFSQLQLPEKLCRRHSSDCTHTTYAEGFSLTSMTYSCSLHSQNKGKYKLPVRSEVFEYLCPTLLINILALRSFLRAWKEVTQLFLLNLQWISPCIGTIQETVLK